MTNTSTAVLRAAVTAAVLTAGLGVSPSQASDISRRVIASDDPTITADGGIRLSSGEALSDALARHRQAAPHLFEPPPAGAQDDATAASRAKLRGMKAGDRLEAANAQGVTGPWVSAFRKGAEK